METGPTRTDLLPLFPHKAEYDLCERKGGRSENRIYGAGLHDKSQMLIRHGESVQDLASWLHIRGIGVDSWVSAYRVEL